MIFRGPGLRHSSLYFHKPRHMADPRKMSDKLWASDLSRCLEEKETKTHVPAPGTASPSIKPGSF